MKPNFDELKLIESKYLQFCGKGFNFFDPDPSVLLYTNTEEGIVSVTYRTEHTQAMEFAKFGFEEIFVDANQFEAEVIKTIQQFILGSIKEVHKELTGVIWIRCVYNEIEEYISYINADPRPWDNSYVIILE